MIIEIQVEYIYYAAIVSLSVVAGVFLGLSAKRFSNKNTQVEAIAAEQINETADQNAEQVAEEFTETVAEETAHETASEGTVDNFFTTSQSEQEVDYKSFVSEVSTSETNYDTGLYKQIADDYNRMIEKIREKEQQQESTVPSGTGFAPRLPENSSRSRRVRRVRGQSRYTGSVESSNPGEFANQVFPKE